jgi:hypothetical protein
MVDVGVRSRDRVAAADDDLPAQLTDIIVGAVDYVRENTTTRALTAAKAVVYGIVVAVMGISLLVVTVILSVRLLDIILPGGVWVADLLIGLVCTAGGAVLLVLARRTVTPE